MSTDLDAIQRVSMPERSRELFFPPALSFQTERLFVNQLSMIQFQRSRGNVKETRTTYYKVWAGPIDHFPPVFLAAFCFAELGFRFARGLSGNTCARSA